METSTKFTIREFVTKLISTVKSKYKQSVISLVSLFVISVAALCIVGIAGFWTFSKAGNALYMMYLMMSYGMSSGAYISSIALYVVLFIVALIAFFAVLVFVQMFFVAMNYEFQDAIRDDNKAITLKGIWTQFRSFRKNQMWRLFLYTGLFTFLWILPTTVLGLVFSSNTILYPILRAITAIISIWKSLEYSQSIFLYREKLPEFLGQSMRYPLTASRRYMSHKKWQKFALDLIVAVPLALGEFILFWIAFYGDYTATYFFTYLGIVLMIIFACAYLPLLGFWRPLYFEMTKGSVSIDETFEKTFKSFDTPKNK